MQITETLRDKRIYKLHYKTLCPSNVDLGVANQCHVYFSNFPLHLVMLYGLSYEELSKYPSGDRTLVNLLKLLQVFSKLRATGLTSSGS